MDLHPENNRIGVPDQVVKNFMNYVILPENPDTECWTWNGRPTQYGYGSFGYNYRPYGAHRFCYMLSVGMPEKGRQVHHTCNNRLCVNPYHLQTLTPKEHVAVTKGHPKNRTHCKRGHEFNPENTHWYNGIRTCRACIAMRSSKMRSTGGGVVDAPYSSLYCKNEHPLFGENMYLARHPKGYTVRQCKICKSHHTIAFQARNRDKVLQSKAARRRRDKEQREARRIEALRFLVRNGDRMDDATFLAAIKSAVTVDPAP